VAALRFQRVRRRLIRLAGGLLAVSRRLTKRPGAGSEQAVGAFLDRVSSLSVPRVQYVEVFALAVWNWVADCLCLAAALSATGSGVVPWHGLFLAYGAAMTAGGVGITPGGLGVIEVALTAALVAAGVYGHHALAAVVVYWLISFWLVMAAGWVVMAALTRGGGRRREDPTPVRNAIDS
jgi:hypothetical protein